VYLCAVLNKESYKNVCNLFGFKYINVFVDKLYKNLNKLKFIVKYKQYDKFDFVV